MGQNNSKPSTMETYRQLPSSKPSLTVHFYGIESFKTGSLTIPLETPISYEQVLIQCAQHLSQHLGRYFPRESEKRIGPLLLPLFGLYAKEHGLQHWVADGHVFTPSHAHQEFYFRIRVQLPATGGFTEKIPQGVFADYLFWQCADDFLSGRVWDLFGEKNKIHNVDAVNFNVLHIFMASAPYRLHEMVTCDPSKVLHTPLKNITELKHVLQKVTFWKMLRHFPAKMTPELKREYNIRRDLFLRFISYGYLCKYIKQFFQMNGDQTLRNLRVKFVENLMKEYVQSYGLQVFDAEKLQMKDSEDKRPARVKLIIRPFQDGCIPGLYFSKKLVSRLQDILKVEIQESEGSNPEQKCKVCLEFRDQATLVLQLASRELAQSVVSVLDGYYRLKVNYHRSLLDNHQRAPSLRVLNMLRSYGPMPEEIARQHLRSRRREDRQCPDVRQYLIYQDCQVFNQLHVLATGTGSASFTTYVIRFSPAENETGFMFTVHASAETNVEMFRDPDPRRVSVYLNDTLTLGQRMVPKEEESCGAMHFFKDEMECSYYSDIPDEIESHRRKIRSTADAPMLYRDDQITVTEAERIAKGKFSEVYHITQVEQERKAILKKVTSTDPNVQEAHRKGAERLMMLQEGCRFFIRVYGFLASSPLRIILESIPQGKGSLLRRLQDRDAPRFTWLHISSILKQLAQCLDFLAKNGMIYGSFCCAKILILAEDDDHKTMAIRLGDPSVAIYLDTLPTTNDQNAERLAWVAPERFPDLNRHTVASEVYAVGTTLWEMVTLGKHPNTYLPAHTSAAQFFGGHQKLPTDFLGPPAPPEEVRHGVSRAQEWVDNTDFSQEAREDTQQTGEDTQEAGEDMQQASDVEEYVTGAQASHAPEGGQAALQRDGAGDQEGATAPVNVPLQKLKSTIRNLIQDCWHTCPDQRPSPTDFHRLALSVRKQLEEATLADVSWQQGIIVEQALQTGEVTDIREAQRIKQGLQAHLQVQHGSQVNLSEERERIEKLEGELRNTVNSIIMHDLLDFTDTKELGKGFYGNVKTAKLSPATETDQAVDDSQKEVVAIKMINGENHKTDDLALFLKEALCICRLQHDNVVKLKGIVLKGWNNPYQLVLEYADQGSLEKYVHTNSTQLGVQVFKLKLKDLAIDVAKGMEYICEKVKRVHGDLAARNVLLFSNSQNTRRPLTAKLCDFGLSHQLNNGYYDLRRSENKSLRIPAYLLPPESLQGWERKEMKFRVPTDIWSYGLLLWEIFMNKKPDEYLGTVPKDISQKYSQGYRLLKPLHCSDKMYSIMMSCWADAPEQRPLFSKLVEKISDLTEQDMD